MNSKRSKSRPIIEVHYVEIQTMGDLSEEKTVNFVWFMNVLMILAVVIVTKKSNISLKMPRIMASVMEMYKLKSK